MKIDTYLPPVPPGAAGPMAAEAARLGFDGLFTAETQHDPFLPLVQAADAGTDLELGTAIAVAFARSPMVTAMTSWDLARLSGGRFILGLGTQVKAHITRRFGMEWGQPTDRLRDYIGAVRAIWNTWEDDVPLRYDGDFYRLTLMTPFFNPGPTGSDIPIYIAGVGPALSRLAGEVADGFHVHPFHTRAYLESVVLPGIEGGANDVGRKLDDVILATAAFVVTGETTDDMEQAMSVVKQQISFYASTPTYRPVLEASGWDFGDQLTVLSKRGEWAAMADVISDEVVAEVAVVAPLSELADALRSRYSGVLDRVGVYALGEDLKVSPEKMAEVMVDFRDH